MLRREFLAATAAGTASLLAQSKKPFDMSRISVITDEASVSPDDAIRFAQTYNLKWVELREVPGVNGRGYQDLSPAELKAAAKQLRDAGLKIAFFNSGGTKFALPGTQPLEKYAKREGWQERSKKQFAELHELTRRQIAAAHAFDCNLIRVFAFARTSAPQALFPRIADVFGEMGEIAKKEGAILVLENEPACNVGNCAELAGVIKLLPESTFALNWDANNGQSMGEKPFPDGYRLLPINRIRHVHMHGKTLVGTKEKLDWSTIFNALVEDGYQGNAGLETHYFDGTKIAKSHDCMKELQRITGAVRS